MTGISDNNFMFPSAMPENNQTKQSKFGFHQSALYQKNDDDSVIDPENVNLSNKNDKAGSGVMSMQKELGSELEKSLPNRNLPNFSSDLHKSNPPPPNIFHNREYPAQSTAPYMQYTPSPYSTPFPTGPQTQSQAPKPSPALPSPPQPAQPSQTLPPTEPPQKDNYFAETYSKPVDSPQPAQMASPQTVQNISHIQPNNQQGFQNPDFRASSQRPSASTNMVDASTQLEPMTTRSPLMTMSSQREMFDKETITDYELEAKGQWCYCCTMRFWQVMFDITTCDFLKRLLYSLIFFKPMLVDTISDNPDLYGPFWIYTSLVLTLASAGNLSTYFKGDTNEKSRFEFDFDVFNKAALFVYLAGFMTPIVLTYIIKMGSQTVSTVKLVSMYGYAYFIYVICTFLSMIPSNTLQWIVLLYAAVTSIIHITVCVNKEIGLLSNLNLKMDGLKDKMKVFEKQKKQRLDKSSVEIRQESDKHYEMKKKELVEAKFEADEAKRSQTRVSRFILLYVLATQGLICVLMKLLFFGDKMKL